MSEAIETGTGQLLCRVESAVAVITLNRPDARNALSDELTPALRRMIVEMARRNDVGALLITGAGAAFCAGGDVKGMGGSRKGLQMSREERILQLRERQRTLTGALVAVRKPTIAALPGPAAGAGLAIALACDVRLMAQSAFVSTGYARVGLSGDYGIAWLLTRLVGTARARELMFTADRVDAGSCLRLGLTNRVVADDDLAQAAMTMAAGMAAGPRIALAAMKENLDRALTDDFLTALDHEAELLVDCAQSEDHKEAVRAFIEKRPPKFQGR